MADQQVRSEILFSGDVQGVGFRYTTRRIAQNHAVEGFVKNLPDGRVQLVVEGDGTEVGRFVRDVEQAMAGHINDQRVSHGTATGEFRGFDIRF